jgi:hypothetical protein
MGATSKVLAVAVIGLAVTGCALTRQAEQRHEVAQRAADDCRPSALVGQNELIA